MPRHEIRVGTRELLGVYPSVPLLAPRATIRGRRCIGSLDPDGTKSSTSYWRPLDGDSFAERKAGLRVRRFRGKPRVPDRSLRFCFSFTRTCSASRPRPAGTILLISRIVDALSDPVIGAIADRTESRWGKYRPWILWTAVPLAAAFVLCFTTPPLSQTGKVVWAIVTCNLLMIVYAANNIPYCALSGVMTDDPSERTSLLSWRFVCVMSAIFVVNTFTVELVESLRRRQHRRLAIGRRWGCGPRSRRFALRSRLHSRASESARIKQPRGVSPDLSDLLHSGPWIALFAMAVLIHIQLAFRGSGMLYYFTHFLIREDLFSWFNGVGLPRR